MTTKSGVAYKEGDYPNAWMSDNLDACRPSSLTGSSFSMFTHSKIINFNAISSNSYVFEMR